MAFGFGDSIIDGIIQFHWKTSLNGLDLLTVIVARQYKKILLPDIATSGKDKEVALPHQ